MAVDKNGKPLPPGIRQRANGKYEGRVKVDYQSHSVYGDTITEVKKRMTELRYKLEHGDFVASSKVTVEEWFKTWIDQYKENQVKIGTIVVYTNCYNRYIKDAFETKKLIERNPVPLATLSKAKPKESHRVLTKEEQDIFMEYAKDS